MSHTKTMPFVLIASCVLFINWSAQETIAGGNKPSINFYGILKTHQGKTYNVENITIDHILKQIPLYEMPSLEALAAATPHDDEKNGATNDSHPGTRLATNPVSGIITKIDLSETSEMRVPQPEKIYYFQRKKGYRTLEFVEIEIISADKERTKHTYLIDADRKVYCDEANPAGPIGKEVPVQSIQSLEIEGYHFRDTIKREDNTLKATPSKE